MSETVHYKGKLTPTGKTLKEINPKAEDIWDLPGYNRFVEIEGVIYESEMKDIYYDDIYEATKNDDGTIDFQVKYYNGGCCFSEAIEEALDIE